MAKSKFFRVMTEGATSDGRTIDRAWIEQMARNYDPARYAARIWMEHTRGWLPDSPFRAYGDVLALKSEKVEGGKLALFAQLDPTPDLVAINKQRQKLYSSAEVAGNFADTGEAYLVGLAVTDSPASLGTEMLQFAAAAKDNPLASRKQHRDNVFTAAQPLTLEFEDDDMSEKAKTLLSSLIELAKGGKADDAVKTEADKTPPTEDYAAALTALAGEIGTANSAAKAFNEQTTAAIAALTAEFKKGRDEDKATIEKLSADLKKVTDDFAAFKAEVDKTPAGGSQRPPANGGNGAVLTDC